MLADSDRIFTNLYGQADWRLAGTADLLKFSVFSVQGFMHTDVAVREWVGLAAYRLSSRTSAFFPAPGPE